MHARWPQFGRLNRYLAVPIVGSVRKGRGLNDVATSLSFRGGIGNKLDGKLQTPTLQSALLVCL